MNTMGISTDPSLLDVELPRSLIESPSVSTFLPEEEASTCPLLSTANSSSTPLTFSHPLTPCIDNDSSTSANLCNEDGKAETSSSSGSSSGIGMDVPDNGSSTLFNKHVYQHLQNNNSTIQDANGHGPNGNHTISKDTPSFVSWNWPLIRKCTFFVFMSSLLAMCAIVVAMIVTLPKTCNPKTAWYRGSVFYEIFPASFQDTNNDGLGDIRGIENRIDYLSSMGIAAVRLNSIFPSHHYPDDYENITSLLEIAPVLGGLSDLRHLSDTLHLRNISLIIDLPINFYVKELGTSMATTNTSDFDEELTTIRPVPVLTDNLVAKALRHWTKLGVDGFYIKGLHNFVDNFDIVANLAEWKQIIGPNRVLIVSETTINRLDESKKATAVSYIDLVDVHLDILSGTKRLEERIQSVLKIVLAPTDEGAWIHWSIGAVDKNRITQITESSNLTLAATILQLMLPGTPSIFYGDEIALKGGFDPHNEHNETKHLHHLSTMQWYNTTLQFTNREILPWLPLKASYTFENLELISKMIKLRDRSPSIYKNAICNLDAALPNTEIRRSHDDIIVVERVYPRRNSFVSVSNFGQKRVKMDMTSTYYSGHVILGQSPNEKIYFKEFEIGSLETIVVKLDK